MIAVFILPLLLEVRSESQNIEEKELAILDELLRVVTDIKEEWELKDVDLPDARETLVFEDDDDDKSSEEDDDDDEDKSSEENYVNSPDEAVTERPSRSSLIRLIMEYSRGAFPAAKESGRECTSDADDAPCYDFSSTFPLCWVCCLSQNQDECRTATNQPKPDTQCDRDLLELCPR